MKVSGCRDRILRKERTAPKHKVFIGKSDLIYSNGKMKHSTDNYKRVALVDLPGES